MQFTRVELYNVGPYYGASSFEPSANPDSPITLIAGMNGAGKTTIINALLLALYGSRSPAFRREGVPYSAYLERLRSRGIPGTECSYVMVDINVGEASIRLQRSWKMANVRYVDSLEVWRGGLPDDLLAKAWDSEVENIIPADLATLFFFDAEKIGELAEAETMPESIRRAIQTVMGITTVDNVIKNLDKIVRKYTRELKNKSGSAAHVRELETSYRTIEHRRQLLTQESAKITTDMDRAQRLLAEAKSEYLRLGGGRVGDATVEKAQYNLELEQEMVKARLLDQAAGPLPLLMVKEQLKTMKVKVDQEIQAQQAMLTKPLIKERNDTVLAFLGGVLERKVADELQILLEQQLTELQSLEKFPIRFRLSHGAQILLSSLLDHQFDELQSNSGSLIRRRRELESQEKFLQLHQAGDYDTSNLTVLMERISEHAESVGNLRRRYQEVSQQLSAVQRELGTVNKRLEHAAKTLAHHAEEERIVKFALTSRQLQMQFRKSLLERRASELEQAIQDALHRLFRKKNLVGEIKLDPETLTFTLYDSHGHMLPRMSLSAGERQMFAIAILWGLTMVASEQLPIVIDTPMARLDTEHRSNFVKLYLPHAGDQVIVLSTDSEIVESDEKTLSEAIGRKYMLKFDDAAGRSTMNLVADGVRGLASNAR